MSSAAAIQIPSHPGAVRPAPSTPGGPRRPSRPALRLVEGGLSPRHAAQRAVFRRRRLAVLSALVVLVAALFLLASATFAGSSDGGGAAPVAAGSAASAVHVVQPGETLWSIAGQIAPGADIRLTVDRLVTLNGGAPLQVGDRLVLP